jgi:DNA helicase II / ATP-dependent DNA helicase PcrA
MSEDVLLNQAEQAAKEALARMYTCIEHRKSFRLEAGAGAGKTYSLVKALKYLIDKQGAKLLRQHQQIACITFTNVAKDEIEIRTDRHPVIICSTIHAFCWSLIKDFQPYLREKLPTLNKWPEQLSEVGELSSRSVDYQFGYPKVEQKRILLGHDDVLVLTVALMEQSKFRTLFAARYPILFVDEYQDTNKKFTEALAKHFLGTNEGPLIGFFGDHWQQIYGTDSCGKVEHPNLEVISKAANFRSVRAIVQVLNEMRKDLPQAVKDPEAQGSIAVYHSNDWEGERLTKSPWKGDLPADVAHENVDLLRKYLTGEGWDFSPDKTKILMLTHNVLAAEQGYGNLAKVFPRTEAFIKKEDPHIAFFVDTLEPACAAYNAKNFGTMFSTLGNRASIQSHDDKKKWAEDMGTLVALRERASIGQVIDHLIKTKRPGLPGSIDRKEKEFIQSSPEQIDGSNSLKRLRELRKVSYQEVMALTGFINEHTPFATQHGVKGAEFENVLVILGRGWDNYNFSNMLEWEETGIPKGKQESFERNRNLFYVVCSRPKTRLALLFTQKLSDDALITLARWFGEDAIHSFVDTVKSRGHQ